MTHSICETCGNKCYKKGTANGIMFQIVEMEKIVHKDFGAKMDGGDDLCLST